MRFIVLAAGTGSRLQPLTHDTPKCLITVAGQTILERLLEQAHSTRRFSEAVVITGHLAEKVASFAAPMERCPVPTGPARPQRAVHGDE